MTLYKHYADELASLIADGSLQPLGIVPDEPVFADPMVVVGADGQTYYRSEHRLVPWRRVAQGFAVQPALGWAAGNVFFLPADAGVTLAGTATAAEMTAVRNAMNCALSWGVFPGSRRFSPSSVAMDQLLCLPEPLTLLNGFS